MTAPRPVRAGVRLARLAAAFVRARLESAPDMTAAQRAAWQQRQARRMLAALDIRVTATGVPPAHGMVVCNHLGYLDVLVIAAQAPVVFVAKSDVRGWPLIGSLLESAGTILAERGRPLSAGKTAGEIGTVIGQGLPVILFPEGTSSDGSEILPFKPTLLQPALASQSPITPAAISYHAEGGNPATDVCYWGDATFFPHLLRLAGLPQVHARLAFGRPAATAENRKTAARELRGEVLELMVGS